MGKGKKDIGHVLLLDWFGGGSSDKPEEHLGKRSRERGAGKKRGDDKRRKTFDSEVVKKVPKTRLWNILQLICTELVEPIFKGNEESKREYKSVYIGNITRVILHTSKREGSKQAIKRKMGEDDEDNFKFVKIKKHVLKVHIHCQGCKEKVKKLVGKIKGVYKVKIEWELQKVSVWGNVECTTLINKLIKAGKHAEIWKDPHPSSSYNNCDDHQDEGKWNPMWDENNHHMNKVEMEMDMDEGENNILMNFLHYNTLPQFNTIHNSSYPGYPLNDYHNHLMMMYNMHAPWYNNDYHNHSIMMYNMHAPWYNNYPYSILYHQ